MFLEIQFNWKEKIIKYFLTSSVTNKYPVRYNNANANIGHFNHIAETPSAYVYDLNDDINEGFVKHDYSDLYDQDLLESVEMNAVEHGIIVLDDNAFISKTTLLTLNKYYCANDYVVEVKGTGSDKGLYIYKLMDNQLTQIEYRATIELSINKPCYIINDSVDSKFLTILARDSSGIITVNELDKALITGVWLEVLEIKHIIKLFHVWIYFSNIDHLFEKAKL